MPTFWPKSPSAAESPRTPGHGQKRRQTPAEKAAAITRPCQPLLWKTPERDSRNHVRRTLSQCKNKNRTNYHRTQASQAHHPKNTEDPPEQGKSALPARSPWARFRAASPPGPATQGPLPSLTCLREAWPKDAVANAPSCGEVPEWLNGTVSKTVVLARVPWVRIPPSPPLSCSEPEMRLPLGAFFFLFQRRLAETPEPRRLAPGPISVSNSPPSLTERTSSGPVRLREGQRFQPVPPFERRIFCWGSPSWASSPREREVGVFGEAVG